MRRRLYVPLLLWALVYSRDGVEWELVGEYGSSSTCQRVRNAGVDRDILDEMGGALALQPADNPLRREAYSRLERRVAARYRCRSADD